MALMTLFDGGADLVDSPTSSGWGVADVMSGTGSFMNNLLGVAGAVELAKVNAASQQKNIYFRGNDGRLYQEGQTGVPVNTVNTGGISPLLLLLIAGGLFLAMKD